MAEDALSKPAPKEPQGTLPVRNTFLPDISFSDNPDLSPALGDELESG